MKVPEGNTCHFAARLAPYTLTARDRGRRVLAELPMLNTSDNATISTVSRHMRLLWSGARLKSIRYSSYACITQNQFCGMTKRIPDAGGRNDLRNSGRVPHRCG